MTTPQRPSSARPCAVRAALTVLVATLAATLAACGAGEPPPPPEKTVFGDLVEQKQAVPAAVEAAQRERDAATRDAIEAAAEGRAPEDAGR